VEFSRLLAVDKTSFISLKGAREVLKLITPQSRVGRLELALMQVCPLPSACQLPILTPLSTRLALGEDGTVSTSLRVLVPD